MHNCNSYILYRYIYIVCIITGCILISCSCISIMHNISTCMFTTYDVKITVAVQSHPKRCFALTKNDAIESVQSLRYEKLPPGRSDMALDTGFCKKPINQQYLQYPKRDPKKDVSLWLHNTACLVVFVASIILRLPFIDPETNLRKKQMKKKSEKKNVFVTPLKINMKPKIHPT